MAKVLEMPARQGQMPVMTWGPFNGRPVAELPDWYLYQLVGRRLWPILAAAVDAELEKRAILRRGARRAA